jgi:hypothetical protein
MTAFGLDAQCPNEHATDGAPAALADPRVTPPEDSNI